MQGARDPRWIVIAESGEYSIIGRHREPAEDDIIAAESALARIGRAGWLAIMSQSAYSCTRPEFLMVRPLGNPGTSFNKAIEAFFVLEKY